MQCGRAGTDFQGVDLRADERGVQFLDGSPGTPVLHEALTQRVVGHRAHRAALASVPAPFVVGKVEQSPRPDRAADRGAEHVADQLRTLDTGPVVEEVVGRGGGVSVEFVERSVDVIRSAPGDQRDLRAG